jgi:glycerophosphoryl diester phosphodiesterase
MLLSLSYFLSLSRISEKSENSHHAKIVNHNTFSEFLQMVQKRNFFELFKLFFFIGKYGFFRTKIEAEKDETLSQYLQNVVKNINLYLMT